MNRLEEVGAQFKTRYDLRETAINIGQR